MRTTLDIDDDVLFAAKEMAKRQGMSMGKALGRIGKKGAHYAAFLY